MKKKCTISNMMQAGGFTSQEDLLKAFPTEESFMNQYPEFQYGGMNMNMIKRRFRKRMPLNDLSSNFIGPANMSDGNSFTPLSGGNNINNYYPFNNSFQQHQNHFDPNMNQNPLSGTDHSNDRFKRTFQDGGRLVTQVPQGYTPIPNRPNYYQNPKLNEFTTQSSGTKMSNEDWTAFLNSPEGQAYKQKQSVNTNDIVYTQPQPGSGWNGQILYDANNNKAIGQYRFQTRQTSDNNASEGIKDSKYVQWQSIDNYGKPIGDVTDIDASFFTNNIVRGTNKVYDRKQLDDYINSKKSAVQLKLGGIPKFSGGGPNIGKPKIIIPKDAYPKTELDESVSNMLDARILSGPTFETPIVKTPKEEYVNTSYNGVSIVDYLKGINKGTSQKDRAALAKEQGIENYDYSAAKNTELLNLLRGSSAAPIASSASSSTTPSTTPSNTVVKTVRGNLSNQNSSNKSKTAIAEVGRMKNGEEIFMFSNGRVKSNTHGMGTKLPNGTITWDKSSTANSTNIANNSINFSSSTNYNNPENYQVLDANGKVTYPNSKKLNRFEKLDNEYNNGKTFLRTTSQDNPLLRIVDHAFLSPLTQSGIKTAKVFTGTGKGWDYLDAALTVVPAANRIMKIIKPILGEIKFSEAAINNLKSPTLNKLIEANAISKEKLVELVKTGNINKTQREFELLLKQEADLVRKNTLPPNTTTYQSAVNNRNASQALRRVQEEKDLLKQLNIQKKLNAAEISMKPPKSTKALVKRYNKNDKFLSRMESEYQDGGNFINLFRK